MSENKNEADTINRQAIAAGTALALELQEARAELARSRAANQEWLIRFKQEEARADSFDTKHHLEKERADALEKENARLKGIMDDALGKMGRADARADRLAIDYERIKELYDDYVTQEASSNKRVFDAEQKAARLAALVLELEETLKTIKANYGVYHPETNPNGYDVSELESKHEEAIDNGIAKVEALRAKGGL